MEKLPLPTHTFVLDIGRKCSINCRFCYYKHFGDLRKQGWEEKYKILTEIDKGVARGNNRCEITGGEPTLYPHIEEVIQYMKARNLKVCIITNGLVSQQKVHSIVHAGVDEFMFSLHGDEERHNYLTQCDEAYCTLMKTIELVDGLNLPDKYRFNCVMNKYNQEHLLEIASIINRFCPTIVNFINMNPHHTWSSDDNSTKEVIADLRIIERQLNEAINFLECEGIGVNVRYYPMCRIEERYRRTICNDLAVMFDDKEWDYGIVPKIYQVYKQWGINTSKNVEEKGEPCCKCDLQWICGGCNKHFHRVSNHLYGELLMPQKLDCITDRNNFMLYRQHNPVGVKMQ